MGKAGELVYRMDVVTRDKAMRGHFVFLELLRAKFDF